ncbi:MAG: ethanolamine utilization protein EutH [Clostridia bacterium]|nr:ethanolamine utilization protein EutH [Clostridia bacterium]
MDAGTWISVIMLFFALIGAADRAIGCRFGPGKAFERGFEASGTLILAMIGPIALAPLIAKLLSPVLTPICGKLGLDPSLLAGLLLADDSGGWPLALALAKDPAVGRLNGSVVGSTMGCAVMFAFPVGFALTPKERKPLLAKGLAIGLSAVPVACFVGGLCLGVGLRTLLWNLTPLFLFSALFVLGLLFAERVTVKIVTVFGYLLTAILTAALAAAMVIKVMNWEVEDFGTFDEGMLVIGTIAIFLAGAFTILFFLEKLCGSFFERLGVRTGMDGASILGMVTTSVNAIPMFGMMKNMNDRGLVVNAAFLVPASFMIGDHLAFQLSVDPSTAVPLIAGKLAGGIAAIALAMLLTREKRAA